MNPRSADKAFAAIRDRAGLDIERFHALRHAFTTLLRASGTRDWKRSPPAWLRASVRASTDCERRHRLDPRIPTDTAWRACAANRASVPDLRAGLPDADLDADERRLLID